MNPLIYAALFGFIGGLARAFFGLLKIFRISKKTKFNPLYLSITLIGASVIGMFSALLVSTSFFIPLTVGYIGIDIVESLIKIYRKKFSLS